MTDIRWDRRQFLARSAAAAAVLSSSRVQLLAQTAQSPPASSAAAPGVITGGIQPLLEGQTARPLRYHPEGSDFIAHNGDLFFNRPVYGTISSFRVDAGDLPELSLYLPGHGGNLKLGVIAGGNAKWFAQATDIVARYRPGRMIYELRDPTLASGTIHIEILTAAEGSTMMLELRAQDISAGLTLAWAFAGASGRKGDRNGDIGCEKQPITQFFQVRPEECTDNAFTIEAHTCKLHSPAGDLQFTFPTSSQLAIADFSQWSAPPSATTSSTPNPQLPILVGSLPLTSEALLYISIQHTTPQEPAVNLDLPAAFAARSRQIEGIATAVVLNTPDSYMNPVGGALTIAAEGLWDPKQECVMHGCVAWRSVFAGWRGPYSLDALGHHDRAKLHFRRWLKKQNISPITTSSPATGPADPRSYLARKESLLHSNGDLSNNHYDMNMVFFDVLLRHLRWTGDLDFAHEIWPAFERHLAWEQRLFRRTFTSRDGTQLPLYEAYAAIWASDNLQYNGGGVTHSSAYNLFAFRTAATLARMLNKDPSPYEHEAALIHHAMQEFLWLPAQGCFAESKDFLGPQTTYNNPAVWTVYHAIDSEVPDKRQAWQMVAERLAALRRIPVSGPSVPDGAWYLLACSDWLPYIWSLTLIALAENIHTALAMWQAGMVDDAYLLLKGNVLDSMYQGQCPANFHMSSQLDAHRQEAQRDFGDPIGIFSRAIIEGLYGIRPNLLEDDLTIRPGFPSDWKHASLRHPDFDYAWTLDGATETYTLTSRLPKAVPLTLNLRARTTTLPEVRSNGTHIPCTFDPTAVGTPTLEVKLPAATSWSITVQWKGNPPPQPPPTQITKLGDALTLPPNVIIANIDDPQHALTDGKITAPGFHTVFAKMRVDDCRWSLPISFHTPDPALQFVPIPTAAANARVETIDLSQTLRHNINEIFTRSYTEPRSPFCSLAIPEHIQGGWANSNTNALIDDSGFRAANGTLHTPLNIPFRTPTGTAPNCLFLSLWQQDQPAIELLLTGHAEAAYLLLTGSTLPQTSRMQHGLITITYADATATTLPLRNPETWWPIEQDYLIDDYIFINKAPLPPRVDLKTGQTRLLDPVTFKGRGRTIPGGSATILHLPLDANKTLTSIKIQADLYGIVVALLGITLVRPQA